MHPFGTWVSVEQTRFPENLLRELRLFARVDEKLNVVLEQ